MNDDLESRLSQISTQWTLVRQAHGDADEVGNLARNLLMERYAGAAYRYLFAATKNPDHADELFQEFSLRFVRGDFRNADPGRGRFRQYVKTALINLVIAYRKKNRRQGISLDEIHWEPDATDEAADGEFTESWRQELLSRAWAALEEFQASTGKPFFSVLRYKAENPRTSSSAMADELSKQLSPDQPWSDTAIRKLLQRSRAKFAEFLLDEFSMSIEDASLDRLEEELIDVNLLSYCQTALADRRGNSRR